MKINLKEMKNRAIFAVVICVALLLAGMALGSTKEKIIQKKTEVTVELGSTTQLHFDATDFFDVDIQKARKFTFDTSDMDLTKVGEYEVTAAYNKERFTIKVAVVDTTKPVVELVDRVVFTNDIERANAGITEYIASIKDASEYTVKLIRFEKKDVLSTMDGYAVRKLEESIMDFGTDKEALSVGSEEIPTQPGIYRSVLEVADTSGNAAYREMFIVLDKTGAIINDMEDMTVKVPANMLDQKPSFDTAFIKGYDEVDGTLSAELFGIEVALKDAQAHEWNVSVVYTDRAGNESQSGFLITVKEDKNLTASNDNGNQNQKPGNSTAGNNGNQNKPSDTPSGGGSDSNTEYDPKDANKDGEVSDDEAMMYITPEKQACIDAGYGVVVELHGGEVYAVLMKSNKHTINGKTGGEILLDYLHEHDLRGDVGGCWINDDNEWYWYIAEDIEYYPYNNGDGEIIW